MLQCLSCASHLSITPNYLVICHWLRVFGSITPGATIKGLAKLPASILSPMGSQSDVAGSPSGLPQQKVILNTSKAETPSHNISSEPVKALDSGQPNVPEIGLDPDVPASRDVPAAPDSVQPQPRSQVSADCCYFIRSSTSSLMWTEMKNAWLYYPKQRGLSVNTVLL